MKYHIENILKAVTLIAFIDAMVVMFALLQVAYGVDTPHIGFWDVQMKAVAHLLSVI